ncbi:MAG: DUF2723 domain-containing protein [Elusimicrobia bacterium]|nr:DUF2723 domain-containing protein [Elusimicrobiota bacterium]
MTSRTRQAAVVFFAAFLLYLAKMPAALAPYRDAGEFAVAARTLGVSHPPSYPLYVLSAHAASGFGAGAVSYRLNLFSGLCAAGAAGLLAWTAAALGPWVGVAAGAVFALDAVPWSVAMVQEMYALMALLGVGLFAWAVRLGPTPSWRGWLFACFAYGLALGDRTDLLLWAPGLLVLGASAGFPRGRAARWLGAGVLMGLAGLSVYLFLPLRSSTGPWLDWNHPAALDGFIGSLTRRGYGGTLDLLSKSYRTGENFAANMGVYGTHLRRDLGLGPLLAALAGLAALLRRDPRVFAGTGLLYLCSGPLFLWLANMPPNPHALAIVEPHYMLSDVLIAYWAAAGAAWAARGAQGAWVAAALAVLFVLEPAAAGRFARMDRRWDLFAHDWADNALRSVPPGAALVAKKDVQIFSLWHHQLSLGRRPEVAAVAQGLAHSPWHQESLRRARSPVRLSALRSPEDWRTFLAANPSVWATMDAEVPPDLLSGAPNGIASPLAGAAAGPSAGPFLLVRGDARYEARPDFFTSDLVESYAAAHQRRGALLVQKGDAQGARRELTKAWSLKHRSPESVDFLAFLRMQEHDDAGAAGLYASSARLYDRTIALTREYNSLPETRRGVQWAAADSAVNMGVALERTGRRDEAEAAYRRALALRPTLARAHFNLAVLYWNRDWGRVVAELEAALAADPDYAEAKGYLPTARARLAGGR